MKGIKIFSGRATKSLANNICVELGLSLGKAEVFKFGNDNTFVRIAENVRQHDVFVVQTSCPPVDENIMETLILVDALRRASAARITAVLPFYPYGRSDKKDQPRVPITARLVADLLVTAGVDRVITLDLHSPQIQGFFTIPLDHLTAGNILVDHFLEKDVNNLTIVATDAGGAKQANTYANWMRLPLAIMDKRRSANDDCAEILHFMGDVQNQNTLIFDDEISTAGTIVGVAKALKANGAHKVYVACTHAAFTDGAAQRLQAADIEEIVVTDSIPLKADLELCNLTVLSVAPLLASAIMRVHVGQSVSTLFKRKK